jgi:UDP-N-acetylglucosamine acyltransferase
MSSRIHPSAIVDPSASIADGVEIGPWCFIGPDVTIGEETVVGPHMRIEGPATIGRRNRFTGQASIGTNPQDLKFKDEKTGNFFMAYAHVAHDCHVGSNIIFANAATLAGHVEVADFATIGALSAIHQFCRVGAHAFIGGATICTQDVLPFVKTVGSRPAKTYGINTIGLERKGFSKETVDALKRAYRLLVQSKLRLEDALSRIESELGSVPEARYFAEFIRNAKRGIVR